MITASEALAKSKLVQNLTSAWSEWSSKYTCDTSELIEMFREHADWLIRSGVHQGNTSTMFSVYIENAQEENERIPRLRALKMLLEEMEKIGYRVHLIDEREAIYFYVNWSHAIKSTSNA